MSNFVYQSNISWTSESTSDTVTGAYVMIYRVGYTVHLSISTQSYTLTESVLDKGVMQLSIPDVPAYFQPSNDIEVEIVHLHDDLKSVENRHLTKIDNMLKIETCPGLFGPGSEKIPDINIKYTNTSDGPTSMCTYFLASRAETSGNSNITVSSVMPGTLVPFKTIRSSYSLTNNWILGVDESTITIPMTGIYQYIYTVTIRNCSNATRTVSSCLRINDVISPCGGSTVKMNDTSICVLVGQQIIPLNTNDQIQVYVLASSTDISITGTSSLFVDDNTSTTISITKIA